MSQQEYIGDGVYASFDGYHIWLRTEREMGQWHEIALEPSVFHALTQYRTRIYQAARQEENNEQNSG